MDKNYRDKKPQLLKTIAALTTINLDKNYPFRDGIANRDRND
jgi:hypothetical protein